MNAHNRPSSTPASTASSYLCLSNVCRNTSSSRTDLSTELTLGLSISPYQPQFSSNSILREQTLDQPPIKSILSQQNSLLVKVYMEGNPIGRKLNLLNHHSYEGLVRALGSMFKTIILCPYSQQLYSGNFHMLTYEDQEKDWMIVGDVPWEMFLSCVKRLKITRVDKC